LAHYHRPAQIRWMGRKRLTAYLRNRGVQDTKDVAARIVAELVTEVFSLKDRIERIDAEIGQRFSPIRRLGFLLACQGWDRSSGLSFAEVSCSDHFESADRLTAYAGLVPAAHDSGKRKGDKHRMRGGNNLLKRVFY
jgi:transposase